jgi:hypothetical protein
VISILAATITKAAVNTTMTVFAITRSNKFIADAPLIG